MPLADEVLEPAPWIAQGVGQVAVVRVVDSAATAEHDLPARAEIELAPAALRPDLHSRRPEVLADSAATQPPQPPAREPSRQDPADPNLDPRPARQALRLKHATPHPH